MCLKELRLIKLPFALFSSVFEQKYTLQLLHISQIHWHICEQR